MNYNEFAGRIGPIIESVYADESMMIVSTDYYLALQKAEDAQDAYNAMRYFLFHAVMPDEEYAKMNTTDEDSILWHRKIYLQTAVQWFNLCGDLLSQMFWLGLRLHKKARITPENYPKILSQCLPKKVTEELKKQNSIVALPILESYYENKHVKTVRNWTNQMKHQGSIDSAEFDGKYNSNMFSITITHRDGSTLSNKDLNRPLLSNEEARLTLFIAAATFRTAFNLSLNFFSQDSWFHINDDGAIVVKDGVKSVEI